MKIAEKVSQTKRMSHNVNIMIYHFVCPEKYRRNEFEEDVDEELKRVCLGIENRYDMRFLEIGTDKDHVHFLIQSIPRISAAQIMKVVKSITAKEIFKRCPEVKKKLWGGQFWSDGYYVSTVGQHGNEKVISEYVNNQGLEYQRLFVKGQLEVLE